MGNVILSAANLPEGTCPPWLIPLFPTLVSYMSANLSGAYNTFNYGNSVPAPADQDKPWIRTASDGTPDRIYVFSGGSWLAPHPVATGLIQLWEGDISTVATFDGGEGVPTDPSTPTTGPMWKQVAELQAKFPIGVGTLPGGTVLAVGSTGGEENHILTIPELAPHTHAVGVKYREVGCNGDCSALQKDPNNAAGLYSESTGGTGTPPVAQGHNTLPPYYALHFLRKTARRFYRYP